jgi:hypothetical protein
LGGFFIANPATSEPPNPLSSSSLCRRIFRSWQIKNDSTTTQKNTKHGRSSDGSASACCTAGPGSIPVLSLLSVTTEKYARHVRTFMGRSRIIRRRESLVLYKSLNTLCCLLPRKSTLDTVRTFTERSLIIRRRESIILHKSLNTPCCLLPQKSTPGMVRTYMGRSRIIRRQESLVLYKSFEYSLLSVTTEKYARQTQYPVRIFMGGAESYDGQKAWSSIDN